MPGGYGGSCLLTPQRLSGAPLSEGPKPTYGPVRSRCDESHGSEQDLWRQPRTTNVTRPSPTTPCHPGRGAGPYREALICRLSRCDAAPDFRYPRPCPGESRPPTRTPTLARPRPATRTRGWRRSSRRPIRP
jgi:hypothetical protein